LSDLKIEVDDQFARILLKEYLGSQRAVSRRLQMLSIGGNGTRGFKTEREKW